MSRILFIAFSVLVWFTAFAKADLRDYKVLRVIDGDTIVIEAKFLPPELGNRLSLRVLHVDTPEKGHLAKCDLEREKSKQATDFVVGVIASAKEVKVEIKKWDKYGGRVLGDLIIDGSRLSKKLLDFGFAVEYNGEKKTKDWCQ